MTVRLNNTDVMYPKETVQLSGLSTDTKPTGAAAADATNEIQTLSLGGKTIWTKS